MFGKRNINALLVSMLMAKTRDREDETELDTNVISFPFSPEIDCNIVLHDIPKDVPKWIPISTMSISEYTKTKESETLKSESIIGIGMDLAESFKPDILGIDRKDNNSYKDIELCKDSNWWVCQEYYHDDDEIDITFDYDFTFVDYGVAI